MRHPLFLFVFSLFLGSSAALRAQHTSAFRVLPYLNGTESGSFTLTWWSETAVSSTLRLEDASGKLLLEESIPGILVPELAYTPAEKSQQLPGGLRPEDWLLSDSNYRYRLELPALSPDETYTYQVSLGAASFSASFQSPPSKENWKKITFMALADAETEPLGRVLRREWEVGAVAVGSQRPDLHNSEWAGTFGTAQLPGNIPTLRYPLTETVGYSENIRIMRSREPHFILMPGDLVQGGGYQPAWDEFFRHNAGAFDQLLTTTPLFPAMGNWENFGGILNNGYGFNELGVFNPVLGRQKFEAYFPLPEAKDKSETRAYYRIDYGPITVLTLDSSNGIPEDVRTNYPEESRLQGRAFTNPGTDTQANFTQEEFVAHGGKGLEPFNPGTAQWEWAAEQLAAAEKEGQLLFVQFHHAPFSSGEHGLPMNHALSSGQGGTPMQVYHPLFEAHGVIAVFSGHSELFERSFVRENPSSRGVHYYDVGVAGDGLRGERKISQEAGAAPLGYNPFKMWTADQDAPEVWELIDGVPQLTSGGKHYGHLEVTVEKIEQQNEGFARITLTPVHAFPVLDRQYTLQRVERRIYADVVQLLLPLASEESFPEPEPEPTAPQTGLRLYPNPAGHQLILELSEGYDLNTLVAWEIIGMNGQRMSPAQVLLESATERRLRWDIHNLAAGSYLLYLQPSLQDPPLLLRFIKK
ncbi:MAG: metallophosphoesterase [Nitritalea sp.]